MNDDMDLRTEGSPAEDGADSFFGSAADDVPAAESAPAPAEDAAEPAVNAADGAGQDEAPAAEAAEPADGPKPEAAAEDGEKAAAGPGAKGQTPPAADAAPKYPNGPYMVYPGYPAGVYPYAVPQYPGVQYVAMPGYPGVPYVVQPGYAPYGAQAPRPAAPGVPPQNFTQPTANTDDDAPKQYAFKVRNLSKDYDGHTVLSDVSFDIPAGKIVGLLGPNGCGKTTLIKILAGLIHDYSGVIKVGGRSIGVQSKAHLAYLPDNTYFPERFRTVDCINYFADFFEDFNRSKAVNFASQFGLDLNQRVKTMSKGMQEKLQLLVVMSRKADIYLLDEPLGGVDPAARGVIMDIIMNNYKENSTVVLSTHLVNDLEHSFDHVLMLGRGKVLVNTGIDVLRSTGKSVEDIFKEVIGDAWEVN